MNFQLRTFTMADYEQVITLWHKADLRVGPTDSRAGILQKLERDADLFLVVQHEQNIIGAIMGSYDGRRGWANHVAVDPDHQGQGIGLAMMSELEERLRARGCLKINLLIARKNAHVQSFYRQLGFENDDVIFMQKWLA